jgi:hypothetical protein
MRKMLLGSMLAIAATALPALADAPWTPKVPVPDRCVSWAHDRDHARTSRQRLGAELSLASCAASARLDAAVLPGGDDSIAALGAAIEPSLAMLDSVAVSRDPQYQILAAAARGDLYVAVITRARIADRDLEPALGPWQDAAATSYASAARLADLHPGSVIADRAIANAVQHSRQAIARPSVAAR